MTERRYRQVMIAVDVGMSEQPVGRVSDSRAAGCVTNLKTVFHTGKTLLPDWKGRKAFATSDAPFTIPSTRRVFLNAAPGLDSSTCSSRPTASLDAR
jgi:hypothetical protein